MSQQEFKQQAKLQALQSVHKFDDNNKPLSAEKVKEQAKIYFDWLMSEMNE